MTKQICRISATFLFAAFSGLTQNPPPTYTGKFDHREMQTSLVARCETGTPVSITTPLAPISSGQTSFSVDTSKLKCSFGSWNSGSWSFTGPTDPLTVTINPTLPDAAILNPPIVPTTTAAGSATITPPGGDRLSGSVSAWDYGRSTCNQTFDQRFFHNPDLPGGNVSFGPVTSKCSLPDLHITKTTMQSGRIVSFEATYSNFASFGIVGDFDNRLITDNNSVGYSATVNTIYVFTGNPQLSIFYPTNAKSLTFNATAPSQNGIVQSLSIANSGAGPMTWSATASTDSGGNWLVFTNATSGSVGVGAVSSTLRVSVNVPNTMPNGTYTGKVTITAPGADQSPAVVPVTLNVTGSCAPDCSDSISIVGPTPPPSVPLDPGTLVTFTASLKYKLTDALQGTLALEVWDAAALKSGTGSPLSNTFTQVPKGEGSTNTLSLTTAVPASPKLQLRAVMTDSADKTKVLATSSTVDYTVATPPPPPPTCPSTPGATPAVATNARGGVRPADDPCGMVEITSAFPRAEETLWERPATFPPFSVDVKYTAAADGEVYIQLVDKLKNPINFGDSSQKVKKGTGTVSISMSALGDFSGLNTSFSPDVYLEAVLTAPSADPKNPTLTKSKQIHYSVGRAPLLLVQPGCVQSDGTITPLLEGEAFKWTACQPGLNLQYVYSGSDDALLTIDKQWLFINEFRGRGIGATVTLSPAGADVLFAKKDVAVEVSKQSVPKNADRYVFTIKMRNKGTLQLMTFDRATAEIEMLHVKSCAPAPNSVLDTSSLNVTCVVEVSTWDAPRVITRQVFNDGQAGGSQQAAKDAHTHDTFNDSFALGAAGAAISSSQVSYTLATGAGGLQLITAADSVRYRRVVQSLDGGIGIVGPDKVAGFIGGSLKFLNGLNLPGKLGNVIKTANEVCSGSSKQPTTRAGIGASALVDFGLNDGKKTDCLTNAIKALQLVLKPNLLTAKVQGPAANTIGILGVSSTWGFDTPQPADGSFAADMTLQYTADILPDHPDFDESKLQVVAWDPDSETFEILPTQLDLTNKTATAHLDHLMPYYSLAMVGPLTSTLLRTPVLLAGQGLNSGIALTNAGANNASARLSAYAPDGSIYGDPANRATLSIGAAAQSGGTADTVLRSGMQPLAGSLEIAVNQTTVAGVSMLGGSTKLEALPLESSGDNNWVLSLVEQNDSYTTQIHVANSANSATSVDFELRAADGTSMGTYTTDIEAKGKLEMSLSGMFPNITEPFTGYVGMTASQDITAAALITSDLALAAVAGKHTAAGSLKSPLAGRAGTSTKLTLVNLGAQDAAVTIRAYKPDGTAVPAASVQVGAGQLYSGDLAHMFGGDPGPVSLAIESPQATLMGDVTLGDASGLGQFRTVLPLAAPQNTILLPYVAGGGTANAVAVSNTSGSPATAVVTAFAPNGSTVTSRTLNLQAYASASGSLESVLPGAAGSAYVVIDSDQAVAAMMLLDPGAGDIAAISGVPLPGGASLTTPPASNPPAIDAPPTIDFGTVILNQPILPRTFTVGNKGAGTLTVTQLTSPGAPFSLVSPAASSTPFDVPAAGTSFMITFSPNAVGTYNGTLPISTNDPANPIWTVALKGTVTLAPAAIGLSTTSLSFGNAPVGQTPGMQVLTVTNTGGVAVTATAKTAAPFSVSPASLQLAVAQSGTFTVTFTPAVVGDVTGSLTVSIGSPNDPPPVSLGGSGFIPQINESVTRSLVYHEITRFAKEVRFNNGGQPVLSSSGNRIVYANAPGDETDARYNDIFVVNSDGSGQRLVDSYKQNCDCAAVVDISADGNTVVSTDSQELRIGSASGSTGKRLITNREIPYVRISPKGDKVFFVHRRGEASATDATTERGLYVINADGTGLKQIAGPKTVAALVGNTPDQIFPFATSGWSLDVSADGTKVVFGVPSVAGERLMSVNADGSGLKQIMGPFLNVIHAALSGDGTKVAYDVIPPPCCSTPNEVGVINYDGSGRKALATNVRTVNSGLRIELSNDGSKLLYGNSNKLFFTDGSGFLPLSVRGGSFSSEPSMLINDGLFLPMMNGTADRFIYSSGDDAGVQQLATMEINPPALGEAPAISSPTLTQASIALSGANQSTISATVKTADKVTRVSAAILNGGINDPEVAGPVMLDDGTQGDAAAGDGVYTSNQLRASCCAVPGPRTVRVKAEVRDAGNRRHATAIEFSGLAVVSKAP